MLVQKARAHFKLLLLEVGIGKLQKAKNKQKNIATKFPDATLNKVIQLFGYGFLTSLQFHQKNSDSIFVHFSQPSVQSG
jgi:hypothetical protein